MMSSLAVTPMQDLQGKRGPQARLLAKLIRGRNYTRGAEVGVLWGQTLHHLLTIFPTLHMTAIDPWRAIQKTKTPGNREHSAAQMTQAYLQVCTIAQHHRGRVKMIRAHSLVALPMVPDGSLDFIFIDGDHTTAGVRRDIKEWTQKVRRGGLMIGDDAKLPSVREAITAEFGTEYDTVGRRLWVRHVR